MIRWATRLTLLLALMLSACSTRIGDLTLASTKNLGTAYKPIQSRVRGEDCTHMILFIPLGSLQPNLEEAVDRAVGQVPEGDMMTNARIYQDTLFTLLYNRGCIRVDGDVAKSAGEAR
jgi:hypothetical protein